MATGIRHNAHEAERQLGLEFDAMERLIALGIQRLLIATDGNLREIAPVDTGMYRAAWDLSEGEPSDFKPAYVKPPKGHKRGEEMPEHVATSQAQSAATAARASQFQEVKNKTFVFTNNLEYASAIEDGHSTLAPLGVAARAQDIAERDAAKLGVTLRG